MEKGSKPDSGCLQINVGGSLWQGALDVGYLSEAVFNLLFAQADEVAWIIGGLRGSFKRRREV